MRPRQTLANEINICIATKVANEKNLLRNSQIDTEAAVSTLV